MHAGINKWRRARQAFKDGREGGGGERAGEGLNPEEGQWVQKVRKTAI